MFIVSVDSFCSPSLCLAWLLAVTARALCMDRNGLKQRDETRKAHKGELSSTLSDMTTVDFESLSY